MNSYQMKNFWCHLCLKTTLINVLDSNFTCTHCSSELIQQIIPGQPHPSGFKAEIPRPEQAQNIPPPQNHYNSQGPVFQRTTVHQTPQGTIIYTEAEGFDQDFDYSDDEFMPPFFSDVPTTFAPIFNFPIYGNIEQVFNMFQQNMPQQENRNPATKEQIDALEIVREATGECTVCQESFRRGELIKKLPCSHFFHGGCIDPWLYLHGSCPVCRQPISR